MEENDCRSPSNPDSERQGESESESGSSYAGSDSTPDKDHHPQISSHGGRTKTTEELESPNEVGEGTSRQAEGDAIPRNLYTDTRGEQAWQESIEPGRGDSSRYSTERSESRSISQTDGAPQLRGHSTPNSTTQPPSSTFDSEEISTTRRAGASTPALSSTLPALSTNDLNRAPQSSSTSVAVPGGNSSLVPESDERGIVLPRWQPDAEVTYCPICRTQFSFFVRKHHCRKCGRVVCNSCSPHRITIPYQFIVQPPAAGPASNVRPAANMAESNESESGLADRYGGMKVRLCNPCVPDPNTLPPQQPTGVWRGGTQPTYYLNSGNRRYVFGEESMNNLERTSNFLGREPGRVRGMSAESGLTPTDSREQQTPGANYGGRTGAMIFNNSPYPSAQNSRYFNQTASHTSRPVSYVGLSQPSKSRGHTRGNQSLSFNPTSSASNSQPHYRSLLDLNNQPQGPTVLETRPLPAIPRIPEEDECPVCHKELPSRTLPNFEDARAAHITRCIDDQISIHNGQTRPGAYISQSQPELAPSTSRTDTDSGPSAPQIITSNPLNRPSVSSHVIPPIIQAPIANTPEARMAAREAAHAAVVLGLSQSSSPSGEMGRRTGMFLYKASEKDCIDDAECTICLEEFEVGVGMARLECLCRFHARCIREWFVDHPGRCPVHQHDGYGF